MSERQRKSGILGAPRPGRRGRKPEYFDPLHQRQREASRRYYWRKKRERLVSNSSTDKQGKKEPEVREER